MGGQDGIAALEDVTPDGLARAGRILGFDRGQDCVMVLVEHGSTAAVGIGYEWT